MSLRALALLALVVTSVLASESSASWAAPLLSTFVKDPTPWKNIIANSDQVQPVYLGYKPREIEFGLVPPTVNLSVPPNTTNVPSYLKAIGEAQLRRVIQELNLPTTDVLFEAWPAYDQDSGNYSWTWARWKNVADTDWVFVWSDLDDQGNYTMGFLPQIFKPWVEQDAFDIWTPVLEIPELYAKNVFGDCVWAAEDSSNVYGAWYNPSQLEITKARVTKINMQAPRGKRIWCVTMPQPCRSNGWPMSFVISVQNGKIIWPTSIAWTTDNLNLVNIPNNLKPLVKFPANYADQLKTDIMIFDGESAAQFPKSGRNVTFKRKSSAQSDNQLLDLVSYLEERYAQMGLQTKRYEFQYLGIKQANLVAIIPGTNPSLKPILFADHFDTAFSEDIFNDNDTRVSNPGADDNVAAIATVLNSAKLLSSLNLPSEIWLVHLTGEEYPGDDLGVRNLFSILLNNKIDIRAMVLMDMISWRRPGDKIVQINGGQSPSSLFAATMAMNTAGMINSSVITPVYLPRWDAKSFLFQTDGVILDSIGFPVVLINEHVNMLENIDKPTYHQSTDLVGTLDITYGAEVAKLATETVAQLAAWPYTNPKPPKSNKMRKTH